jgi:hypothetical protein
VGVGGDAPRLRRLSERGGIVFGQNARFHTLVGFVILATGLAVMLFVRAAWPIGAILVALGVFWTGFMGHVAPLVYLIFSPLLVTMYALDWLRRRRGGQG